ncbi:hypothetical protein EVAR_19525_1 [Eumeta japonica]|uniref:Uncharacterized protein n=1 Tax=Eumeta variegata TaxID=151549 RepID=A0A4C1UF51_EUMVA|nr:hypothetical protein EVAR_19525_1 [Eumeta japonica]
MKERSGESWGPNSYAYVESWVWQKENKSMINAVDMLWLRSMCGVSQKDRCRNSDVRKRCGLKKDVVTRVEREGYATTAGLGFRSLYSSFAALTSRGVTEMGLWSLPVFSLCCDLYGLKKDVLEIEQQPNTGIEIEIDIVDALCERTNDHQFIIKRSRRQQTFPNDRQEGPAGQRMSDTNRGRQSSATSGTDLVSLQHKTNFRSPAALRAPRPARPNARSAQKQKAFATVTTIPMMQSEAHGMVLGNGLESGRDRGHS